MNHANENHNNMSMMLTCNVRMDTILSNKLRAFKLPADEARAFKNSAFTMAQ